ncbi:MAG: hypothetical protein HY207_02565 [Nitrospirae bacterium]|nr:hypothetical protein [Nitrospirota bacterium]
MKVVKIRADGSIKLPKDILRVFPAASEVAVSWEGDTIMLKRLIPLKPSRIKKGTPEKVMSIEEIGEEIHEIRREKRGPRA